MYCRVYHELFGVPTLALRYFNVFGPRQNPKSQYAAVIPAFITNMLDGRPPVIYGDGQQSRDFTHVENVIHANLACLEAPVSACGQVYNVGYGSNNATGTCRPSEPDHEHRNQPLHQAERPGDVRHSCASTVRAEQTLKYAPKISVLDGLRRTVEWFRARGQA